MLKFFAKGYSHGDGYTCKVIGLPAGEKIDFEKVALQLKFRRQGFGRSQRMQTETDKISVLSGMDLEGKTNGFPLVFFIKNTDNTLCQKPKITAMRSGHADLVGCVRLKKNDARLVCELASARRTVAYTAFGAICKQILENKKIYTYSIVRQIGKATCKKPFDFAKDYSALLDSDIRCLCDQDREAMRLQIERASKEGDSIGGVVEVGCLGLPMGLGDFVNYENKFDGVLAQKMMSIPSVKGVSFGVGEKYGRSKNSCVADKLTLENDIIKYATNNCGGIVAGMTTGGAIVLNLVVKAPPTTKKGIQTIDLTTHKKTLSHFERSDVCIVPSVGVVAENILAATVLDLLLKEAGRLKFCTFDFNAFDPQNTIFVTDKNVEKIIDTEGKNIFVADAGEEAKSITNALNLLTYLENKKAQKTTTIVAVGGGAICDLAGFVASIYKRGINFVTVPTTLLAMVDAGIGGKNAINFLGVKNQLGSFFMPQNTIIDFTFLNTNTKTHIAEGFGEIVKCGLLSESVKKALETEQPLQKLIRETAEFKQFIVSMDQNDEFWRQQLNLGHTLGHSFEVIYNLPHGIAVLNGLYYETLLANYLGLTEEVFCKNTIRYIQKYIENRIKITSCDIDKIIELCRCDKKNNSLDISFVYAKPYYDFEFAKVTEKQLKEFLKSVC